MEKVNYKFFSRFPSVVDTYGYTVELPLMKYTLGKVERGAVTEFFNSLVCEQRFCAANDYRMYVYFSLN